MKPPEFTPIDWIVSRYVDEPSKIIWAVMMGVVYDGNLAYHFPPHTTERFDCTYRLLKKFPQWRQRLHEVSRRYPQWTIFVQRYDELEALYEAYVNREDEGSLYEWRCIEYTLYDLPSARRGL